MKQKENEQAELDRKKKMQEKAREKCEQRAEEIRNQPNLREQQEGEKDEETKEKSEVKVASPTPGKPKEPINPDAFNNFLERNK